MCKVPEIKFNIFLTPSILKLQAQIKDIDNFPFMCHDCRARKSGAEKNGTAVHLAASVDKSDTDMRTEGNCDEVESHHNGSGVLIMIDTTKTANQKRKEAAAARRSEKKNQKYAAKMLVKPVPLSINPSFDNSEGLPNFKQDTSLCSDAAMLPPGAATNNENSQCMLDASMAELQRTKATKSTKGRAKGKNATAG